MKKIIINADDFGLNDSCTKAIGEAFKRKLITDTTMVANGEAIVTAVEMINKYGMQENIGIHFNLTEGKPLTEEIKKYPKFVKDGMFHGKINRLTPLKKVEKEALHKELTAQIEALEKKDINITHADSHHHIHTGIFISPIVIRVCKEHNVRKIRLHRNIGIIQWYKKLVKKLYNLEIKRNGFITTKYFGSLEDIEVEIYDNTEIMIHPDYDKNGVLIDRKDVINGIPSGNEIPDLKKRKSIKLINYRSL